MSVVVCLQERWTAGQLARLSEQIDDLSVNVDLLLEKAEQRLIAVEQFIEAIDDPAIIEKLSEERECLVAALKFAKTHFETQISVMKAKSSE